MHRSRTTALPRLGEEITAIKTIGLLRPGDTGSVVAKVLQSHGTRALTCLKGRSELTRMLAREAQTEEEPHAGPGC